MKVTVGVVALMTLLVLAVTGPMYADVLPAATYCINVTGSDGSGEQECGELPSYGAPPLSFQHADLLGQFTFYGLVSNVPLPGTFNSPGRASVLGEIDQFTDHHPPLAYYAFASLSYFASVQPVGNVPAGVTMVPIDVTTSLFASVDSSSGGTADASAFSKFLGLNLTTNASCNLGVCTGPGDLTDFLVVYVPIDALIDLKVGAHGSGGYETSTQGFLNFQAIGDPLIQIDPSFQFADDFQVVYSPNMAPVPEPSTFLLLGSSLVAVGGAAKRKLSR